MRRSSSIWGVILILVGGLFLLKSLGLLGGIDPWSFIWPVFLIGFGLWFLLGATIGRRSIQMEQVSLSLEAAGRAKVRVRHGAGRLQIGSGAGPGELVSGSFGGGLDHRINRKGDAQEVDMRLPGVPNFFMNWGWGPWTSLDWDFALNGSIPLELDIQTGASETKLDLTDLLVTDLSVKTGASSTVVTLPTKAGYTGVRIEAGAASIVLRVPENVAARIRVGGALSGVQVDRDRFPRQGGMYQSPDYETAENKAEIHVETGVGSITVR
jgi:hypothetical protein